MVRVTPPIANQSASSHASFRWAHLKSLITNHSLRILFVALDTCNSNSPATSIHLNSSSLCIFPVSFRQRKLGGVYTMNGGKRSVDARRVAGSGSDCGDNTVIDRIMLRFRPIAPRPVTAESSGYVLPASDLKTKRVKRKYVREKKKASKVQECNLSINDNKNWFDLDRTVEMIEDSDGNQLVVADPVQKLSSWISFDLSGNKREGIMNNLFISEQPKKLSSDLHGVDLAPAVQRSMVVESWITVESVTGACDDRRLIGYSDDEIWKNLESDSRPGFMSNGYDEVLWVNPAYRRMLDLNPDGGAPVVRLVLKVEKSTVVKHLPAFTCRVRIEYRLSEKKTRMMVPCDVCKLDSGGFAWLLDVRFALSLGPLN